MQRSSNSLNRNHVDKYRKVWMKMNITYIAKILILLHTFLQSQSLHNATKTETKPMLQPPLAMPRVDTWTTAPRISQQVIGIHQKEQVDNGQQSGIPCHAGAVAWSPEIVMMIALIRLLLASGGCDNRCWLCVHYLFFFLSLFIVCGLSYTMDTIVIIREYSTWSLVDLFFLGVFIVCGLLQQIQ